MAGLYDRTTLAILASALAVTILCILPATNSMLPFSLIARGMHVGDLLFHEMGHTIFNWLFGRPAIPMIFTIFGADQAGGLSLALSDRIWPLQIAMLGALVYGCKWLRDQDSHFFLPAIVFTLLIAALSLTRYPQLVIYYMGHGSSIAMGGFFLYRAILYLDARGAFERWLNAFFGFYLIGANFAFSYGLAFDDIARDVYQNLMMFGAQHHDFAAIADEYYGFTITGIARFTLAYCAATLIASIGVSYYRRNDY